MAFSLLALLALAGPGDPPRPEIVAGEDLGAWQDLIARRPDGTAEIALLEEFLAAWPESPLAEVAWARLRDLGVIDDVAERHPDLAPWLPLLERSRAQHEIELSRRALATAIVPLDADGEPIVPARKPRGPR